MNKIELAEKVKESLKSAKTKAKKFQDNVLVSFDLISEESNDNIYVAVRDGELIIDHYRYDDNQCEVEATAETVAKMFSGELSFAKAVEDGLVKISGDVAKLMALECLVPSKKTSSKATKAAPKKEAAKSTAKSTTKATATVAKEEKPVAKATATVVKEERPVAKAAATVAKEDKPVAKVAATVAKEDKPVAKAAATAVKEEKPVAKTASKTSSKNKKKK